MKVGQVIDLAREWVDVEGSQLPGFCGAHLMGSLNYSPRDALFPPYKDVDLNLVFQGAQGWAVHDEFYKGLILEYGSVSAERYRSPELVLSDPELASNLAVNSVLSDPMGMLAGLHEIVAQEYSRRRWVQARCQAEKHRTLQSLDELGHTSTPAEAFVSLWDSLVGLAGLIAIADLKPPTHRRCLILMKHVLETWNRSDLQEETLEVYGCAHMSRTQVNSYLQDCARAFDRAVEVTRTSIPFGGWKLHAHVRPYLVEGAQEMIDEGHHREAMFWIAPAFVLSNTAIQLDAPEGDKPRFQANLNHLLFDMGFSTSGDLGSRLQRAKELTENVFHVADDIVSRNTKVID